MPKIVDWDQRRDEILSATWRVIARDGIAGATIRAIAKEANCSRGILGHYFDDKADILSSALVHSHRRVGARMTQASAGQGGLKALRTVMLEALPLDERRDLEAQIEISFWGRALGNASLRDLQHSEFDRLSALLRAHLDEAAQQGELAPGCDPGLATHQLLVLIDGLSAERELGMLDRLLNSFRLPAPDMTDDGLAAAADAG